MDKKYIAGLGCHISQFWPFFKKLALHLRFIMQNFNKFRQISETTIKISCFLIINKILLKFSLSEFF